MWGTVEEGVILESATGWVPIAAQQDTGHHQVHSAHVFGANQIELSGLTIYSHC